MTINFASLSELTFSYQRKPRKSLRYFKISTIKNACLISAKISIELNRNSNNMSKIFESKFGPEYIDSFKDGPSDAQDASREPVFWWFLYLPIVLVDAEDNELDQAFLELHQKAIFQ